MLFQEARVYNFHLLHLEHLGTRIFRIRCSTRPHSHGGREAGRLTQGHPGSAGVRVDPEREPGENHNQQGRCIHTHHVEANLSPQREDDFHTRVVTCQSNSLEGQTRTEPQCGRACKEQGTSTSDVFTKQTLLRVCLQLVTFYKEGGTCFP